MLDAARGRLPAHVLHLARLRAPVLLVGFGRVVVMPGFGGPCGVDARVERPVRQVDAAHRVGQRLFRFSADGASHSLPYHARMRSRASGSLTLNGSTLSGRMRGLRLLVRHELRRAAEFAVLRLPRRIEHRDRVAALALDLALAIRLPAARVVADAAQRGDEIVLDDRAAGIELRRRFGAAERADELLPSPGSRSLRRRTRDTRTSTARRSRQRRPGAAVSGSRSRSRARRRRPRPRA